MPSHLERAAWRLYALDYALAGWADAPSTVRNAYRRRIIDRLEAWQIGTADRDLALVLAWLVHGLQDVPPAAIETYREIAERALTAAMDPDARHALWLREIVMPEPGERVVVVPQSYHHLYDLAPEGVVGQPATEIDPLIALIGTMSRRPYWCHYSPAMPYLGSALLLVRDGIVRRGPQNWDSPAEVQ